MSQPFYKIVSTVGGFGAGWWALSESLVNHSKTTVISYDDYRNNANLRSKILRRHQTMQNWLNVDMEHAKRYKK